MVDHPWDSHPEENRPGPPVCYLTSQTHMKKHPSKPIGTTAGAHKRNTEKKHRISEVLHLILQQIQCQDWNAQTITDIHPWYSKSRNILSSRFVIPLHKHSETKAWKNTDLIQRITSQQQWRNSHKIWTTDWRSRIHFSRKTLDATDHF